MQTSGPISASLRIIQADYANPLHAAALVSLLDDYARDISGGGEPVRIMFKTPRLST